MEYVNIFIDGKMHSSIYLRNESMTISELRASIVDGKNGFEDVTVVGDDAIFITTTISQQPIYFARKQKEG